MIFNRSFIKVLNLIDEKKLRKSTKNWNDSTAVRERPWIRQKSGAIHISFSCDSLNKDRDWKQRHRIHTQYMLGGTLVESIKSCRLAMSKRHPDQMQRNTEINFKEHRIQLHFYGVQFYKVGLPTSFIVTGFDSCSNCNLLNRNASSWEANEKR